MAPALVTPIPSREPGCPDNDILQRFLTGWLPEAEAEVVERHLEGCLSCLGRLGELSKQDRRFSVGWGLELGRADEPVTFRALIQGLCRPSSVAAGSLANAASPSTPRKVETTLDADLPVFQRAPLSPARIGRYQVVRALGAGGMGAVYLAEDPELCRLVAVKVPQFAGPPRALAMARQRFLREARAAAAVRHPHVCPVYDVGMRDGTPYVVMAFIEGCSLGDRLEREDCLMDWRAAVHLAIQVAEGLAAVHDCGLIHRDLKPSNILIDGAGDAFLSDFGLARRLDDADRLTTSGALVGTPDYMAPEQVDDAAGFGPVTARTDLFSLGVILYEMLTGRRPFEAKNRTRLLYQIVQDTPRPPSHLRPDLDPRLEEVILKALAKNPADRWPNCRTFAVALAQCTRSHGLPAPAPAGTRLSEHGSMRLPFRPETCAKRPRGYRRLIWWVGVFLAGLALGPGSFLVWQAIKRPTETREESLEPIDDQITAGASQLPPPSLKSPRPGTPTIEGHTHTVHAVALSADGKLLATAGEDKSLRIWDVATGTRKDRIPHEAEICSLAFAPDGKTLAAGGADRAVVLWDVATREKKNTIPDSSPAAVTWIAFAPDSRTLVTLGYQQNVALLWDVGTAKQLVTLKGHTDPVRAAAFSPDSKTVATVSDDKTVRLWDAATGKATPPWKAHDRPVYCLAFSPDGKYLATGSGDQTIVIWDLNAGKALKPDLQNDGGVAFVGWTRDGRIVAKTSRDGVTLWNPSDNKPVVIRKNFDKPLVNFGKQYKDHAALSPDGRILAFRDCYWTRHVHLLDLSKFIDAPK